MSAAEIVGTFPTLAPDLIAAGYLLVPISPGKKFPALTAWQSARLTPADASKFPDCGVGILTGQGSLPLVAIDIDVLDADLVERIVAYCRENLGDTVERVGDAPKRLLVYQAAEAGWKKAVSPWFEDALLGERMRVEILAQGQQFVSHHTHPDTGRPYEWIDPYGGITGVPADRLPVVTQEQLADFMDAVPPMMEEAGHIRVPAAAQGTAGASPAQRAPRDPADFFGRVNDAAMQSLGAWVPALLPDARPYHDGYRVAQVNLGHPELEEDLSIVPAGIVDFGVHDMGDARAGKRTPIDLVIEWAHLTMDDLAITRPIDAALWLCDQMGVKPEALGYGIRRHGGGDAYRGILDHIEQAPVDADPAALAQAAIEKAAHASLNPVQDAAVLAKLKTRTGLPMLSLRRQLQEARAAGDDESATHHAYALDFIEHLTERSNGQRPVGPEGRIFTFNNGIWTGREPDEYAGEVATRYDGRPRCERRSDYQAIPRHAHDIVRPGTEAFFEHSPVGVAAGPWFYRIDAGRLVHERLSPEHRVRYALPFEPAAAPATTFDTFLAETFASPTPGEAEEQTGLLQEIAGAIVTGTMARHQKVVLFKGDGRAGKGTVQRILEELVPDAFRSATSPFTWDGEYYLAKLAGRRLNIVGELPDDKYIPAATFKTVTGGDLLEGRHPSGRPFSFRNSAAHVFSSNHFINTNDVTDAFFARWLILEFPNSRLALPADQIDAGLADRIIGMEMPAILDWALRGAIRLAKRGHFKTTRTHDRLMSKWRARASSLLEFIQDESACELGEHFNVPRAQFFARYREHCANTGRKPIAKAKLYEELTSPAVAALGVHVTPRTSGQRERVAGLRLVDGLDPFE